MKTNRSDKEFVIILKNMIQFFKLLLLEEIIATQMLILYVSIFHIMIDSDFFE